jgi:hypothetical protein
MPDDPLPPVSQWLTPQRRAQFDADVAALRDLHTQQDSLPLRLGDLFNELKERWQEKLPALAERAGVPYHTTRKRARVAEAIPPGSPLRSLGLPYSILCLLAPVAEPGPWAQKAVALQKVGLLKARDFAQMLEEGGARKPRSRRAPRCLHCGGEVNETPERTYLRRDGEAGWLCSTPCALAYLAGSDSDPAAAAHPEAPCDSESHSTAPSDPDPAPTPERPAPAAANRDTVSQPSAPAPPDPDMRDAERPGPVRERFSEASGSRPRLAGGRRGGTGRGRRRSGRARAAPTRAARGRDRPRSSRPRPPADGAFRNHR